jgi:peptidoglycan/LPS O-acetylase OafA/YrhL
VAILAVLIQHAWLAGGCLGSTGVDIFFVLSGFLITCLLIEEWDEFHSISLKAFYLRRALRLLPALVLMLTVWVVYYWLFSARAVAIHTTIGGVIALFYSTNWAAIWNSGQLPQAFAHTWTLSIEEQFYLSWAVILLLMLWRTRSRSSMLAWVALAVFLTLVEKVTIRMAVANEAPIWRNFATESRADALLIGCALAIALSSGLVPKGRWPPFLAWGVAVPGLVLLSFFDASSEFYFTGFHLAVALLVAIIILHVLTNEWGVMQRCLAQPWLVYIGTISYGLYLWHYPVFAEIQARNWNRSTELAAEFTITAVATLASFYMLERPVLRFKRRFEYAARKT